MPLFTDGCASPFFHKTIDVKKPRISSREQGFSYFLRLDLFSPQVVFVGVGHFAPDLVAWLEVAAV
ncbi:MAG: hypothetical protein U1A73_19870, partial [Pseudomonas sp.]|nr:hypothetical protein [Pseudomonas sp.]